MTTPAWISLGSNLGDRRAILDEAVARINQAPGMIVTAVSSYRETKPVGGPPGQGPFLNAAARLVTTLSPRELLAELQLIETKLGRARTVRWGERTLDLDILIYGSKFIAEPDLKLPHPRLAVRRFVLEPLAEIGPNVGDIRTGRRIADLLARLDQPARILMLDDSLVHRDASIHQRIAADLGGIAVALKPVDPGRLPGPLSAPVWSDHRDKLAKVETLHATWRDDRNEVARWSVFNFAIDIMRIRETCSASWVLEVHAATIARAAVEAPKLWFATQLGKGLVDLPEATMIVSLSDPVRPRFSRTPIYRTEATEPDAIVAEMVAVCRGIEKD